MFNKLFRKNYVKLQSSTKGTMREVYEEVVYFMHQPSSINLRFLIVTGIMYGFVLVLVNHQKYYAEVFKRKRIRNIELQNSNMPPMTREENELLNKSARINYQR